jgi:hypothetical protein
VDGFRFPMHHLTIEFGDGGTLKSLHALRTAGVLAIRGLRVLYCDYQLDEHAHRGRLEGMFPSMPEIPTSGANVHWCTRLSGSGRSSATSGSTS